jgi:hypothetical protein
MGGKMIKDEGNNMGKFEDVAVVNQGREKTQGNNVQGTTQNMKMNEHEKRLDK